jgi:hypothetical protein
MKIDFTKIERPKSQNPENLKSTWLNRQGSVVSATAAALYGRDGGDLEYVRIFENNFPNFSGKILEIGAGTGFFAKQILTRCPNVEYTILDIKKNIEETVKETLSQFKNVEYITSANYGDALVKEYDLFIETHCLSETPPYYYTDILSKLSTKACLVIDYAGDPRDPGFEDILEAWFDKFDIKNKSYNSKLVGGHKRAMPVYIGRMSDAPTEKGAT